MTIKQFEFESDKQPINLNDIPVTALRKFGKLGKISFVQKAEQLRESPPNIIIAECLKKASFTQNNYKMQSLRKRSKYVMNLGIYRQLWCDPNDTKRRILKPSSVKFKKIYRPYTGQNLDNKSLLIIRSGGIGDLLFIQPNLTHLKKKYPTCKISLACGPQYHPMVQTWDCLDKVLSMPFALTTLINSHYHAVFEGVIERCEEAHTRNAYRLFTEWLGLDLPDSQLVPKQTAAPDKIEACKTWMSKNNVENFILFQLRASSPIRTPRPEIWREMIRGLVKEGHDIVLTDAPFMTEQLDEFIDSLEIGIKEKVFNFSQFSPTLDFSIALLSLAKCVVSPDSSMLHIAASLDVPGFGLYGAFSGEVRLSTYKNIKWINAKKDCAPCFTHGSQTCQHSKNGHPTCYDNIDTTKCINEIKNLLPIPIPQDTKKD